jgi:hypothetical protein
MQQFRPHNFHALTQARLLSIIVVCCKEAETELQYIGIRTADGAVYSVF